MSIQKNTILLVEDQAFVAKITKINFSELNCNVDIALDGKTAIEQANNNIYDLIIMDIGLPDIDGYEVTKKIRLSELNANVPIVALTAHADDESQKRCIQSGMNGILIKPLLKEKAQSLLDTYIPKS